MAPFFQLLLAFFIFVGVQLLFAPMIYPLVGAWLLPLTLLVTAVLLMFQLNWSRARFFASQTIGRDILTGMGAFLPAYALTWLLSSLIGYLVKGYWGEYESEQAAVEHLRALKSHPALYYTTALLIACVVPWIEEVLFRGYMQQFFTRFLGQPGLYLTAFIFAALHYASSQGFQNIELLITLLPLALILGALTAWRGNLWPSLALHMTFNTVSVILLLLGIA